MEDVSPGDREPAGDTCGCAAPSRRVCDVCRTPRYVFVACSFRCLRTHLIEAHGGALPVETAARARDFQKRMNLHPPGVWDRYASHRQQLMSLVPTPSAPGDVCVFGAGSCSDIDLEQLSRTFGQIHLVDLDGEALERARERQSAKLRERVVLHGDVDLSGFLDRLDEWGDAFPSDEELGRLAVAAAHAIVRDLGRAFDVTVSSCVLSQLTQPFQSTWVMSEMGWGTLDAAVTAVHLATLAGATRSGGRGFIAFDVLSSDEAPALFDLEGQPPDALPSFVARELNASSFVLQPDPDNLLLQLQSPGLGSLFASPRLTQPWLWDIRDGIQLVYGLMFERR